MVPLSEKRPGQIEPGSGDAEKTVAHMGGTWVCSGGATEFHN